MVTVHVDWFKLLHDMKLRGFTLLQITEQTGIPKSTIIGYKNGAEPKHCDGERLIALWESTQPKLPVIEKLITVSGVKRYHK